MDQHRALELHGRLQPPVHRGLIVLSSVGCIVFGAAALYLAGRSHNDPGAIAWGTLFIIAGIFNAAFYLWLPPVRMLRIDDNGMTWYSPFNAWSRLGAAAMQRTLPWADITDMRVVNVPMPFAAMERVLIVPRSPDSFIVRGDSKLMRILTVPLIRRVGGVYAPPTEIPASQLLQVLHERWLATRA